MTFWLSDHPPILASGSATRRLLLETAGLAIETAKPDVDERALEQGLGNIAPKALALELARAKAREVSTRFSGRIVIAADQTLEHNGKPLHKPQSREQAYQQFVSLSNQTHSLHSAVALARGNEILDTFIESATLTMRPLSRDVIELYLNAAGDKVFTSVGGYQIEGLGIHLFESIQGDHSTILGLPLLPLFRALRRLNVLL